MFNHKLKRQLNKLKEENERIKKEYEDLKILYEATCSEADKKECFIKTIESIQKETSSLVQDLEEKLKVKAKSVNCEMGEWCKDCKHCKLGSIEYETWVSHYPYVPLVNLNHENVIWYCEKWLHDICKGWEKDK